jgi:predicted DNA repair protein MutK
MFMVGGSILLHGVPAAHHALESAAEAAGTVPAVGPLLRMLTPVALDALAGLVAGALALLAVSAGTRVRARFAR